MLLEQRIYLSRTSYLFSCVCINPLIYLYPLSRVQTCSRALSRTLFVNAIAMKTKCLERCHEHHRIKLCRLVIERHREQNVYSVNGVSKAAANIGSIGWESIFRRHIKEMFMFSHVQTYLYQERRREHRALLPGPDVHGDVLDTSTSVRG